MDPQITLAKVLRPYPNFEDVYQGQANTIGIPFFEPNENGDYSALDPDAGKPGFAPNLLRYVDVPMGSRIVIWVPATYVIAGGIVIQTSYRYRICWRIRNVTDYRNRRTPYHNKRQFPGQPDTTNATNPQRTIIPAASRTVVINQDEVAAPPGATQIQHLRRESINFLSDGFNDTEYLDQSAPLVPNPAGPGVIPGAHQQGILDPAAFPLPAGVPQNATNPIFMPFWCDCEGDQILIMAVRDNAGTPGAVPWDFGGEDAPFSNIYGRNFIGPEHELFDGVGIYLFSGVTY